MSGLLGMPEHGGFADLFQQISRRLAALERSATFNVTPDGIIVIRAQDGSGNDIHIRPGGAGGSGLLSSITYRTGANFATSEPFVETENQGGGVWALKLAGPVGSATLILLQSNGLLNLSGAGAVRVIVANDVAAEFTANPTAGQSAMVLAYHNGTSVVLNRVTVGAADSGGTGFKLLRVPN